jgi:hypothetical protein
MQLGAFSFILQVYYVHHFVMHMRVSDVKLWWDHIDGLDLASRYGVKREHRKWRMGFGGRRDRSLRGALADRRGARSASELRHAAAMNRPTNWRAGYREYPIQAIGRRLAGAARYSLGGHIVGGRGPIWWVTEPTWRTFS